jgi:hypothetical protein
LPLEKETQGALLMKKKKICRHKWQPVSFAFENESWQGSQLYARYPSLESGRVYCVCMKCCCHTYIDTRWVGYYIGDPALAKYRDKYHDMTAWATKWKNITSNNSPETTENEVVSP